MPSMPPRKSTPPRPPVTPPAQPENEEPEAAAASDDGTPNESFLSFGDKAKESIKNAQESNAFRGYREFFITKEETNAALARKEQGVTVRVHFARNYALPAENVSVPRCTIMQQGRPTNYTSAGEDCALAAAGVPVSIRPVYVLIDHRSYKRQDKSTSTDDLKLWVPPPAVMGIMENAVKNLAENLGCEPHEIDLTKHEAKLTKIGSSRQTTWAIDFVIQHKVLSKTANDNMTKAFGTDGYKKTLAKWLAPNPRYMISKGGHYTLPKKPAEQSAAQHDNEAPPY